MKKAEEWSEIYDKMASVGIHGNEFDMFIADIQDDALEAAALQVESVNAVFVSRDITAERIRALKPKQE